MKIFLTCTYKNKTRVEFRSAGMKLRLDVDRPDLEEEESLTQDFEVGHTYEIIFSA